MHLHLSNGAHIAGSRVVDELSGKILGQMEQYIVRRLLASDFSQARLKRP